MNIGKLTQNGRGQLSGTIATIMLAASVMLVPVQSTNAAAPKYEIHSRNVAGNFVQIGAFWEKTAAETGEVYLQGRITDPSFGLIYITAFRQVDGSHTVVWSRARPQAARFEPMKMAA